jgi:tRNA1Val (adenine37-N6)-methyltransferase
MNKKHITPNAKKEQENFMPNPYFQFKQFTIYHDRCVLKVSTDSCILGAWVAETLCGKEFDVEHVLDIGAGSGLLMLMLAQKYPGRIDGIEIDPSTYEQALENIQSSPWKDRLKLHHHDATLFQHPHQYDFIISNPPFFEGDLKSGKQANNLARHDDGLSLSTLLEIADINLTRQGRMAILLPYHRMQYIQTSAPAFNLFVQHRLLLQPSAAHAYFRCILLLGRQPGPVTNDVLHIKKPDGSYTSAFEKLLKDYYLKL